MIPELKHHQIGTVINLRAKASDDLVFKMKTLILSIFRLIHGQLIDKIYYKLCSKSSLPSKIINVFYYIAIMVQTVQGERRHVSNYF